MHPEDQEAIDNHRFWVYGEYLRGFAGADAIHVSNDPQMTCEGHAAFVMGQLDRKEMGKPMTARQIIPIVREMCEE